MNGLATSTRKRHVFIAGAQYYYRTTGAIENLIFMMNISVDGYVTTGFQVDHPRYRAGISYDINWDKEEVVYKNTIELGFQLKGVFGMERRTKEREKGTNKKNSPSTTSAPPKEKIEVINKEEKVDIAIKKHIKEDSLKTKTSGDRSEAHVGDISQDPLLAATEEYLFHFDLNSTQLDRISKKRLKHLSTVMKDHPYLKVRLIGHTDDIGTAEYNQKLSLQRAHAVKILLETFGIDNKRIKIEGRGEEQSLVSNDSQENRAKNRRVSLEFFYQ